MFDRNQRAVPNWAGRLKALPSHHGHAALASLGRLWRRKGGSLLSSGVAGIALALPLGLVTLVHNAEQLTGATQSSAKISIFLRQNLSKAETSKAIHEISHLKGAKSIRAISPRQAEHQFEKLAGFKDAFAALNGNPFPPVIVLIPLHTRIDAVNRLAQRIKKLGPVGQVVSDTRWVARLDAMLAVAQRAVWVVGGLLGLAVIMVVANTTRLEIESRRTEIEVQKLVGATNSFIRRPFLYGGVWYGACAGVIAWILVEVALGLLAGPVHSLGSLYQGDLDISGPGAIGFFSILFVGGALGWLGALITLGRRLREVEPD